MINSSLYKILDRKQWEMCAPCPVASTAGSFIVSSGLHDQFQLFMPNTTTPYLYDPNEDAWILLPTSGLAGTFGAGSCGTFHPNGPTGTAQAGTSTTITLASGLSLPGSLANYKIRITAGTGAGQERTISTNTVGTSPVVTVTSAWTVNPDATSQYLLLTGRYWIFVGNNATQGLRFYDTATNTWSAALSVAGVPATFATDAKMRATPGSYAQFDTKTATGSTASTVVVSTATWTVNQWTNSQVRILSGTGAGQVRTVASNTATTITVSSNWTVNPSTDSVFVLEGNDDFIYLAGNAAVAMYRYSISANTWTTLAPGVARAAAPSTGMSLNWIYSVSEADWNNANAILNGRRLYSFRGGATSELHFYDIASNAWTTVTYLRQGETFTTGTSWDNAGNGHLYGQKDATSRFFRYDVRDGTMDGFSTLFYAQGVALLGDRLFTVDFTDGGDKIQFLYHLRNTGTELFRCMIF